MTELERLEAAIRELEDAVSSGDVPRARSIWAEDACCILITPQRGYVGIESICGEAAAAAGPETELGSVEINPLGGGAAAAVLVRSCGDVTLIESQFWMLRDGRWRLCHAHRSPLEE